MKQVIYTLLISLSISCSPILQQPSVELPEEYSFRGDAPRQEGDSIGSKWWEIFGDTTLNRVVEFAIQNNRDIAASIANVEAARAYVAVAKSEYLPSLSLKAEAEAYRINGVTTKEFIAAPTLTWEISLFGALRNSRREAMAEYLSKEWGYRAALLSLTSEVATTLFTLAEYQRSYKIAIESYNLRVKATALVDSMHRYGMSNGIALEQAKSLVYSAKSEIETYRRAVEQTSVALALLLGVTTPQQLDLHPCPLPPEIPIGIPSELLERRADVMESYYTMQATAAKVGIARAERFPSISLTAYGGFVSETLKDLTSAKPIGWSLLGDVAQPIFNFSGLKRSEQMARQEYTAAMKGYEQATLSALSDVETALVGISTYRTQLLSSQELVRANAKIAETTSALYVRGMGDYLSVIDAQRELYASQIEREELISQQYINYVNLIKALGGGWD